jgi:hypothetical protein
MKLWSDKALRGLFVVIGLLVGQWVYGSAFAQPLADIKEQLHKPVPGGVVVLEVLAREQSPTAPIVTFDDQRVLVMSDDQSWWAIVGIPISTEPGLLSVAVQTPLHTTTVPFTIEPYRYREQHITLKDRAMVTPPPQTLERIKAELQVQIEGYQTYSDRVPSNLLFDPPVSGRKTSPFGLQRYFNGQARNPHSGLDFAAPIGTPVKSPADGRVILIGDYYFNGLTVFIDHGQGVISMFCHLSQINHLPGDEVKRGDVVALVGNTGRSTGPHLHWNVSLNNARVDPELFLRR